MNSRLKAAQVKLYREGLDALIVLSPANISYLTGYRSRDAYLVISPRQNIYITDSRYTAEARRSLKAPFRVVQIKNSPWETISGICLKSGFRQVGFEARHILFSAYQRMCGFFPKTIALTPVYELVEESRQVKEPQELKKLVKACRIAVSALKSISGFIAPGRKELEIAAEIEKFIRYQGASGPAFEVIVASGPNAAFPHHLTSERKLKKGEPLLIDMGADYLGYKSDLTRVFFSGRITLLAGKVYDIVRKAQELAIAGIKPGVEISEIDAAGRKYIASQGYGACFGHNLGHGIGLEVHEAPAISSKTTSRLQEGMVFTVEPGIYLPGRLGIRIEDMVRVTRTGCEVLSGELEK